jgi:hypothetical protein
MQSRVNCARVLNSFWFVSKILFLKKKYVHPNLVHRCMCLWKKIPISDKINGNLKSEILTGEPRWPLSNPLSLESQPLDFYSLWNAFKHQQFLKKIREEIICSLRILISSCIVEHDLDSGALCTVPQCNHHYIIHVHTIWARCSCHFRVHFMIFSRSTAISKPQIGMTKINS